jgi:hypothetical protein
MAAGRRLAYAIHRYSIHSLYRSRKPSRRLRVTHKTKSSLPARGDAHSHHLAGKGLLTGLILASFVCRFLLILSFGR